MAIPRPGPVASVEGEGIEREDESGSSLGTELGVAEDADLEADSRARSRTGRSHTTTFRVPMFLAVEKPA